MTSGYSIATLVVFILSIIFVIQPVSIPAPCRIPRIPINLTTAPILAIAILWAAQCIDPAVIRAGFVGTEGVKPYNIIILFFSLAYMAITLDITGILQAAAFWVSNKGGSNGWKLYFYFYVMLTFLSILLGNDPVILSGTAFLVYYTEVAGLSPTAWIMAEFAAANTASMVLFVGNPTNVVICEGFSVNNAAFTAYTILPFIACNLVCFIALGVQYRKEVPRKLKRTAHLDPRSVLHDPVGAWVGSFLLGSTLVLCLVVGFFGIDVWMISLPFACSKFIFDIAWDHYRYTRGIPMLGRGPAIQAVGEPDEGAMVEALQHMKDSTPSSAADPVKTNSFPSDKNTAVDQPSPFPKADSDMLFARQRSHMGDFHDRLQKHFPTFFTALPRLPFALVPFAFSQFILIEALAHQGWVDVFATWLVRASHKQMHPTIWLIGVLGVILCNLSGTNIGATILLTKVVRAAALPYQADRAAAIALAVASNIGAVSFTFSASLAGLLWRAILKQKGITVKQTYFACWNSLPLLAMTAVGLGVVSAEMAVLFKS
jgi:Na+/H+ antiporter NhaD/arsenite permease-like protein